MYDRSSGDILDYHRSMLADRVRTERFREAIREMIHPGDIVLDLGCGTGILSLFALQAGAARVHAIEMGPVIELARSVCRVNNLGEGIIFHRGLSTEIALPEQVDLIVTETIGNFGFDEGIVGSVLDARRRFLRREGALIPRSVTIWCVPVEFPQKHADLDFWKADVHDLDFSAVRKLAANNVYWDELGMEHYLAQPQPVITVRLTDVETDEAQGEVSYEVVRPGVLHGIGGWFAAELTARVTVSNAPPNEVRSWHHGFLPAELPVSLQAGDLVRLALRVTGSGALWRWQVVCTRPSRAEPSGYQQLACFDQASFFGQLLSIADFRKLGTSHPPRLTEKGQADRFILDCMDGHTSVQEIARRARQAHPSVFNDDRIALRRVRILSQKYSP